MENNLQDNSESVPGAPVGSTAVSASGEGPRERSYIAIIIAVVAVVVVLGLVWVFTAEVQQVATQTNTTATDVVPVVQTTIPPQLVVAPSASPAKASSVVTTPTGEVSELNALEDEMKKQSTDTSAFDTSGIQ